MSYLFEVSSGNEVDRPNYSHHTHALGVDIDISTCYSSTMGKQTGFQNPACSNSDLDFQDLVDFANAYGLFVVREGNPPTITFVEGAKP
jgi:hypothetical protein